MGKIISLTFLQASFLCDSFLSPITYGIQHVESRQKEDEKRLENVNRAFQRLEKELSEKNSKIESFENLVRTLFDRNKLKLESLAVEVRDLQTQLQQKDQTIYDVQTQLQQKDQTIYDLQTKLQQKNRTIYDLQVQLHENDHRIYDLQSHLQQNDYVIYDLQVQLHENDHRIQYLESKGKVDEEKLQCISKANKHLETQLEEEKNKSNALEKLSRTLSDEHNTLTIFP